MYWVFVKKAVLNMIMGYKFYVGGAANSVYLLFKLNRCRKIYGELTRLKTVVLHDAQGGI